MTSHCRTAFRTLLFSHTRHFYFNAQQGKVASRHIHSILPGGHLSDRTEIRTFRRSECSSQTMSAIQTATTDRHYCSHRHLTAEALVRCRDGPCAFWRTKCHWDRLYFSQFFGSPLSVPFHHCSVLISIDMPVLPEGQAGETWKTYKSMLFRKSEHCIQKYCLCTVRSARCLYILTICTSTHSGEGGPWPQDCQ